MNYVAHIRLGSFWCRKRKWTECVWATSELAAYDIAVARFRAAFVCAPQLLAQPMQIKIIPCK